MIEHTYEPMLAKDIDHSNYVPRQSKNKKRTDTFPKSKAGLYVDEATYWDLYYEDYDFKYEWNNGILEEKEMPTLYSVFCSSWFGKILEEYLLVNPIAMLIKLDFGFRLNLPKKTTIRKPDFALILKSNSLQPDIWDCSYKGIYDICIEFLSETKKKYVIRDTVEKKKEYSKAKVKEYYIIDANKKHTAFYRLNHTGRYIKIKPDKGVIRSEILPGFQFKIDDLYTCPELKELIKDDIYKSYVKVDFQKQCQLTELERKAKEKERKAREKELKAKEKAILEKEKLKRENILLKKLLKEKGIAF